MRTGSPLPPLPRLATAVALVAPIALTPATPLRANPQGAQIRHGQVRIQQSPGHTRILQSSQRAVIDWHSFSVRGGETTRFVQPNSRAAVLNRVRGPEASRIEGALRANGQVYLINPNGVLVGPNGTIDVGGFVASTLDVADDAFLRGGDLRFSGNSAAAVVNLGAISALDGDVVLMGASVRNAGSIRANRGTAALAAGDDILLAESGEERVFVRGGAGSAENTGSIEANVAELKAHGGNLYGMAIRNEGRIAATGVTRSGGRILLTAKGGAVRSTGVLRAKREDGSGGDVRIEAGPVGRTEVGGVVDASGSAGAGGDIAVLGREIEIFDGALILNDGATAGGDTRIGGGLQGQDPAFGNAENVVVGRDARLSADATGNGKGGQVIIFAKGSLVFDGFVSARGGSLGGNGGFAELSGKETVRVANLAGRIDLSAPAGQAGTFLYDPTDISILPGYASPIGGSPVTENTLYADDISSFLATANLIVTTASSETDVGNITMDGAASISWGSASSLTFLADNDFVMNPGATISANGAGAFGVTAGRSIRLGAGAEVATTDGELSLLADQQATPTEGDFSGVVVDGATVRSLGSGNVVIVGHDLVVDGGTLSASSSGSVSLDAARGILVRDGAQLSVIDGNLDLSANFEDAPPLPGSFTGITVLGSNLSSTGGGGLSLVGRGGDGSFSPDFSFPDFANPFSAGIRLAEGTVLSATGAGSSPGSLYLDGRGGGGASDSIGVAIEGTGTRVETAVGNLSIFGQGGGVSSGARNRGILVSAAAIASGATGELLLEGKGGMGFDQIDGIQLQNGATLQIADGLLQIDGFAGGSLGIGVMATGDSGDIRTLGSGEIRVFGAGVGAPGVQLGNAGALLGGDGASSLLVESEGDLVLARPASVAGPGTLRATRDEILVETPATSTSGDLRLEGFDLAINAPLSAPAGNLTLQFGEQGSNESEPSDGVARINAPLVHGGSLLYLGGFGGGDFLTFENFAASGIDLAFDELAGIEAVVGSSFPSDLLRGTAAGAAFEFNGIDQFDVGGVAFASFESVLGGGGDDTFAFVGGPAAGSSFGGFLGGTLDGGGGNDTLDYSGYTAAVAINLSAAPFASATGIAGGITRIGNFIGPDSGPNSFSGPDSGTTYLIVGLDRFATPLFRGTGFQNLAGGSGNDRFLMGPGARLSGRLAGGKGGDDLLGYGGFGRPVTVEIGPNTATGIGGGFEGIEAILGSGGNDRFRFLDQATIGFVDGGGGTDLLEIDDSSLAGSHTYTIGATSISRNPVYNFRNVETVRLFLGSGDNTVASGFFPFTQFLHAGPGFNTLQLPGIADLAEANPVGNVYHFGFAAPRPAPQEGDNDTGSLLRREVTQRSGQLGGETKPFLTENRFSIVDPDTLAAGLALANGAFPAALVAQASVVSIDGNSYLVMRPFSLDGSGLSPSNLVVQKLAEALGVDANLELAAALGLDGGVVLLPLDGPYGIDLSAPPADPAILALLQESLSIAAAAELSAALGLQLAVSILSGDGIVPAALDGSAPPAAIVAVLAEQLGEAAFAELNSALGGGN